MGLLGCPNKILVHKINKFGVEENRKLAMGGFRAMDKQC